MSMAEMVARTLTPEMAAAASTLVKIAHPGDTSLSRACDRAQERLFNQPWTVAAGILQIASHSTPGDVQQTDGDTCTCPTSKGVCYHIAGWLMISALAAAGVAPVAPLPLPIVLDEDELTSEYFLDGPFDAYDDDELTAPGDEGREWYSDEGGGDFEEVDDLGPRPQPASVGVWYKGFYYTPEQLAAAERERATFRLQPSIEHSNPLDSSVDLMFAA